ncbi:DoxX family protein [Amycolatopsis suaedae]|uniref:Invasion protein n=1 Tax=Amycolatopsis suaedae TaxID=2510978 RepID=A0A4Q7JF97_9PSEU|nr:DoxX family protein [Amycolatopsis suaedae]RZQ66038.1 invasion protein [Amycolatopsis suaedae]
MQIAFVVMSLVLGALFLFVGLTKVLRQQRMVDSAEHLGFSVRAYQAIGALEIGATAGLVVGLFWRPLGIAAAAGLALLLIGAVIAHVRAGDEAKLYLPAAWLTIVSAATAVIGVLAPGW